MSIPLLKTKLHISRPKAGTVTRPRLTHKLTKSSQGTAKLALVVAPAGFGKTTLLSAWQAANPDHPVAWLSLDDDDNDPSRFWSYTAAALEIFTHVVVISHLARSCGYGMGCAFVLRGERTMRNMSSLPHAPPIDRALLG